MRKDARRLVGQMFGGKRHLVLNFNFMPDMFAVFGLFNFPNFFRHNSLCNYASILGYKRLSDK